MHPKVISWKTKEILRGYREGEIMDIFCIKAKVLKIGRGGGERDKAT